VEGNVQKREAAAREAKLELVREQVESGELVIRQMTRAEGASWEKQQAARDASSTPAERARREAALKERRRRANRLRELES
jgi:hypothetical protein